MPTIIKIKESLVELKKHIETPENKDKIEDLIALARAKNPWFKIEFSITQLQAICAQYLDEKILDQFSNTYPSIDSPKKIGIVAAGNLPLVCFHDLLCVLLSGHQPIIKPSSNDFVFTQFVVDYINQLLGENWIVITERLTDYQAVIATGSSHSASVFKKYFSHVPALIRASRTSVAVLHGNETNEQLGQLCDDIFLHFGMGCRNITYLLVPNNYDFIPLLHQAENRYKSLFEHTKYMNNYDYRKTIMLLNSEQHYCTDFVLLQQSDQLFSPISCLHYQFYNSESDIKKFINTHQHELQCVAGLEFSSEYSDIKSNFKSQSFVTLGLTQFPTIEDFADGVNTMEFLINC
jgi:hypothetical protein